ncbi:MAG: hypothetical protein HYR88_00910 [Verrucomicrobia bacterium]|nr:hypothetical protein [Verrucomicrobiota bacterium]
MGRPDAFVAESRIACYRINTITRRRIFLCLFVIPIGVERSPGGWDVAFIEFDADDRVSRSAIGQCRLTMPLEESAREWLAKRKP